MNSLQLPGKLDNTFLRPGGRAHQVCSALLGTMEIKHEALIADVGQFLSPAIREATLLAAAGPHLAVIADEWGGSLNLTLELELPPLRPDAILRRPDHALTSRLTQPEPAVTVERRGGALRPAALVVSARCAPVVARMR